MNGASRTFWKTFALLTVASATLVHGVGAGDLAELARQGRWEKILEIAQRREAQLPLMGMQALVAATAAARRNEPELRQRFLQAAVDDPAAGAVARVELAQLALDHRPGRSVELVLPLLRRTPSTELQRAAARIVARAVRAGIEPATRARIRGKLRGCPRNLRRMIDVELAAASNGGRRELRRVLEAGRTDLVDQRAAAVLSRMGPVTPRQRWLVASSAYRHAHYAEALHLLRGLTGRPLRGVPLWKARFLRGRCAFRLERWREAVSWYRRARKAARRREDRSSLLVHEARALELAGDLDAAARRAGEAVRVHATDGNRLFLARLELARGHPGTAARVLARLHRTTARDRGLVLRAIDAHAHGDLDTTVELLGRVGGRTWRGPARILAARACLEKGRNERAAVLLEAASQSELHGFWCHEAVRIARALPPRFNRAWTSGLGGERATRPAASSPGVLRLVFLVTGPADRHLLRQAVGHLLGLSGPSRSMSWRGTLARTLWEAGLPKEAARWNPRGFPGTTAFENAWSARQFLLTGHPTWSIRRADAALRPLGTTLPADSIPPAIQRSLFPLPYAGPVLAAAGRTGIPWQLLAALVREESRWNPGALSAVGARGLTQLMPRTAREAARRAGLSVPSPEDLFRPAVSLRLGAAELAHLLEVFQGRRALAVAAYNAGEPQVRLWIRQAGARSGEAWFLASIGFGATRSYTSEVLWAQEAYETVWHTIGITETEP